MTFDQWWSQLAEWHPLKARAREFPSTIEAAREAWNTAVIACADKADELSATYETAEDSEYGPGTLISHHMFGDALRKDLT